MDGRGLGRGGVTAYTGTPAASGLLECNAISRRLAASHGATRGHANHIRYLFSPVRGLGSRLGPTRLLEDLKASRIIASGDLHPTLIGRMVALVLTLCYEQALRAMQN